MLEATRDLGGDLIYGLQVGLATSSDGVRWLRGGGDIQGQQGALQEEDVGRVLGPNPDWWWHDTRGASVSDVQVSHQGTPTPVVPIL